jgi:hypothetical protein
MLRKITLAALFVSACSTSRIEHSRDPAQSVTGPIPMPLAEGQEYASLQTVRFAKIVSEKSGETWTMAIIGSQYLFHENDPKAHGAFAYQSGLVHGNFTTDSNFGILSAHLREQAMAWDIARYKEEYPHIDPKIFEAMLKKDSGLDEKSALIMLFKGNDASQVISTLRVSYPDPKDSHIPLDELHHRLTPRPERFEENSPAYKFLDFKTGEVVTDNSKSGFHAELKNFVKDPSLGPEISPLMLLTAERWGLTSRIHMHDPTRKGGDYFERLGRIGEYWLVADARMKNYYTRFGFEVVQEDVDGSQDLVMKIPRDKFIKKLSSLWGAEGGKIVRGESGNYQIDYKAFNDVYERFGVIESKGQGPEALLRHFNLEFSPKTCTHLIKSFFEPVI